MTISITSCTCSFRETQTIISNAVSTLTMGHWRGLRCAGVVALREALPAANYHFLPLKLGIELEERIAFQQ